MFAETIMIGEQSPIFLFLFIIVIIVIGIIRLRFIFRIKRTIRGTKQLRNTIQDQHTKIDKLQCELEDLKRK